VMHLITAALASVLFLSPLGPDDEAVVKAQLPTYPLTTCVVSGEAFDMGEPVDFVHEGRLVRFCCDGCVDKFKAEPAKFLATIDRAVIAEQKAHYPLKTCVKSGEPLGDEAVDVVVGTRLVRTCCNNCARKIAAEPAEAMKKLDAAYIEQQKAHYALKNCVVSGEALEADAQDMLYGNTLVRLCCNGCRKEFAKDPGMFLKKVARASNAQGHGEGHGDEHGRGEGHDEGHGEGRGDHGGRGGHG